MQNFIKESIELACTGIRQKIGGPFGAIIVQNGIIVGRGQNCVTSSNDPTAHAEIMAIRDACKNLATFQLEDCAIYTSCEPCPMCLGAIYWARLSKIYYAANRHDAAIAGFDDEFIYNEFSSALTERKIPLIQIDHSEALLPFKEWRKLTDKIGY